MDAKPTRDDMSKAIAEICRESIRVKARIDNEWDWTTGLQQWLNDIGAKLDRARLIAFYVGQDTASPDDKEE